MFRRLVRLASEGFLALYLGCLVALADTPASFVTTTVVGPGQAYPEVATNSEGWYDVGGFCKVVDVGGLTWTNPQASGVPVFIPDPAAQWENYRTTASGAYNGDVVLTTCCRSQSSITTLCANTASPVSVSRQYGKLGETDTVAATCTDAYGTYTESIAVTCSGDDGPDGQAAWVQAGSVSDQCAANAWTSACSAVCPTTTGTTTTRDSCGNITSTNSCTITGCCTSNGSCSGGCGGGAGVDNCGNACINNAACCTSDGLCYGHCGTSTGVDTCGNACGTPSAEVCTHANVCSPSGIANGSIGPYPYCAITCDSGYSPIYAEGTEIGIGCAQTNCTPTSCSGACGGFAGFDNCGNSCTNTTACMCPTVANGTTGAYPGCAITCNSGYTLSSGSCTPTPTAPPCAATIEVWGNYCAAYFSGASGASDTESTVLSSTPGYIGCNGSATYSCSNGALTFVSGSCTQSCSNATTCNPSSVTNGTVGAYPGCAITCNSGYTLSNGRCVAAVCPPTCTVANGTCTYGAAPSCAVTITGCNSGYTVSLGQCVAVGCPPTCTVANGTCSYGAAPSCPVTITGCNSGYTLSNGSCMAVGCQPTCTVANGTCSYGAAPSCPESIICNQGYTLSGNVCVANAPICTPNWVTTCGACSQTTGKKSCTKTDTNNCPGSTSTPSTQNCAYGPVGSWQCSFAIPDYEADAGGPRTNQPPATGGYTEYWDCGYLGDPNGPAAGYPSGSSWVCTGLCDTTPGVTCYPDPLTCTETYQHFNADGSADRPQTNGCATNSQYCLGSK